jgi:hypothetical protein
VTAPPGPSAPVGAADDVVHRRPPPNPFAEGTDVAFTLPSRGRVRIDVFDAAGRHVRTLIEGVFDAGPHIRHWDGLDSGGRRAAGGVYFVQMQVGERREAQKMVRLR